jgi:hypothetical protein
VATPDYILEVSGLSTGPEREVETSPPAGRPWLAVHWKCCNVYSRVYRNIAQTAYEGACPSCGKPVRAGIGSGGTSQRFFAAS